MKLINKTRGDSSPQGKAKVFLAISKADYDIWTEIIAQDILEAGNVTVCYLGKDSYDVADDELISLFDCINLVVFPLTSVFFENKEFGSRLLSIIENRKPYIPIMLEPDLLDDFTEAFGNVQFLDPYGYYKKGEQEIPYKEKLKNRLFETITTDDEKSKIEKAFRAQVFLSYRKVDRVEAQKLMKLLHSEDSCKDIAVWYDEFLIPGEDFNDAILSALESSDLVALNVTNNLLEKHNGCPNYVMAEEYPRAYKSDKPILSVEMAETDKRELAKNYEGIEKSLLGLDEHDRVPTHLLTLVQAIKKELRDESKSFEPLEKGYYLGLAYMNGYMTELDANVGEKYIRNSAENGLVIAMKRLAIAYKNGEFGKTDMDGYFHWFKEAVAKEAIETIEQTSEETLCAFSSDVLTLWDNYIQFEAKDGESYCTSLVKKVWDELSTKVSDDKELYQNLIMLQMENVIRNKEIETCSNLINTYLIWTKEYEDIGISCKTLRQIGHVAERLNNYGVLMSAKTFIDEMIFAMNNYSGSQASVQEIFECYKSLTRGFRAQNVVDVTIDLNLVYFENDCPWWMYAKYGIDLAKDQLKSDVDSIDWNLNLADILYEKGRAMTFVINQTYRGLNDEIDKIASETLKQSIDLYKKYLPLIGDRTRKEKTIRRIAEVAENIALQFTILGKDCRIDCEKYFCYAVELGESISEEYRDYESNLFLRNLLLDICTDERFSTSVLTDKAVNISKKVFDEDKSLSSKEKIADAYLCCARTTNFDETALRLWVSIDKIREQAMKESGISPQKTITGEMRQKYRDVVATLMKRYLPEFLDFEEAQSANDDYDFKLEQYRHDAKVKSKEIYESIINDISFPQMSDAFKTRVLNKSKQ